MTAPGSAAPAAHPTGDHPGEPTISWSGHSWYARDSSFKPGGPGVGGNWSRSNVGLGPDDDLILRVTNPTGDSPVSAELISRESFGYGSYELIAEGPFDTLDPALVFGFFTFDWGPDAKGPGYDEIDVAEISAWGKPAARSVSHTYYLRAGKPVGLPATDWPAGVRQATFRLGWTCGRLEFGVEAGAVRIQHTVSSDDIPIPRHEAVHVNLWDGSWDGQPVGGQHSPGAALRLIRFAHTNP